MTESALAEYRPRSPAVGQGIHHDAKDRQVLALEYGATDLLTERGAEGVLSVLSP